MRLPLPWLGEARKLPLPCARAPAYGGPVIVSCPKCSAQYRVAVGVVMRRPRLKCAACSHRWVPAEEIDEDEAVAAVQEEARAASLPPPPPPEPEPEPEPEPPPPRQPPALWLKWLVAIVLGAAFTTASVGLWVGRIDPEALPGVTDALAQVAPPATPLDVKLEGRVTRLPGGNALLEVTGTIHNPGTARVAVPPLNARLLVNGVRIQSDRRAGRAGERAGAFRALVWTWAAARASVASGRSASLGARR
jgi:hypothetical protein